MQAGNNNLRFYQLRIGTRCNYVSVYGLAQMRKCPILQPTLVAREKQ